jgi:hypothetical protein
MMVRIFHPSSLGTPSYFWTHRACFAQLWVATWSSVPILAPRSSWMPMNEPHTCMTSCPWTMWSCPLIVVPCPLTVVSCPRGTKLWPSSLTTYITSCLATTVSCPWVTKPWPLLGRGVKGGVFFSFFWGPPSFSWGWLEWRSHGLPTLVCKTWGVCWGEFLLLFLKSERDVLPTT